MADVTDATFQTAVVERSQTVPVVVDLWAPWCGPCRTLGPILDKVIGATNGRVELTKVNVDENPSISQAFRVQSIPAVYAMYGGKVVDGFTGAQGEAQVTEFVNKLLALAADGAEVDPVVDEIDDLLADGDVPTIEAALAADPGNERLIVGLAAILLADGDNQGALDLLAKVPEHAEARRLAAMARTGAGLSVGGDEAIAGELDVLLTKVKGDDDARQRYVDLLEVLGPDDPRTAQYRRRLTSALF